MKKLAIIGAGRIACIFAENAKDMGIETHCFAWEEGAMAKEYADYFYPISIFEKETILAKCRKLGIGGVVATTELTIPIVAYLTSEMGLNGNPVKIAELITDKYRNRNMVKSISGLKQPKFAKVRSIDEFLNYGIEYPVIVKPTSRGGKRGISVAYSKEELELSFRYAVDDAGGDAPLIVEEYLPYGKEYSVETLSYHGEHTVVQVTDNDSSGPPHCAELGHHQPANIPNFIRERIDEVFDDALTAIGLVNGPCCTEIKIVDNEIYLIEFNARPGGDLIAYPLTELSTGYPYIKGAISIAFDDFSGIDKTKFLNRYAGVYFVTKETEFLMPIFKKCHEHEWFYKKNEIAGELQPLIHNDEDKTNYFVYLSDMGRPDLGLMGE